MKKIISFILVAVMIAGCVSVFAFADTSNQTLKFNSEGKFKIVHLSDVQDVYPLNATTKEFIKEMLAELKPDIVVLGGDNCVADAESKETAIKELCSLFVDAKTYFTFVFGNHDHQQMFDGQENKTEQSVGIRQRLLEMYQRYGGDYCLAYDAAPDVSGVAKHNLPIYSNDGSKIEYNLYMMDSNAYYPNENEDKGYDGIHPDELDWYKSVAAQLKEENGGKPVPAMMFQHIVMQESVDTLFISSSSGGAGKTFEDIDGNEKYYTYLPKLGSIQEGFLFEYPCPNYRDYGQLAAIKEAGDVVAVFSGHDHTNSYKINVDGIDIINTPGCTYHSYGNTFNRGVRVIDLDEKDLSTYSTFVYTVAEQALKEGSTISTLGDISKGEATLAVIGAKLLAGLMSILSALFFFIK